MKSIYLIFFLALVKLNNGLHERNKRSLVFVFDTTGSMQENLNQLRSGAKSITSTFAAMQDNPIDNYIFVDYNDPIVMDPVITKDRIKLLSLLDKIKVDGGEDCDELGFEGIQKGLEVANDDSYVFIFTDAPSKDKDKIRAIEKLIQRKRAQLFFIVHLDCNEGNNGVDYRRLAKFSNGFYFDVKGKDVSKNKRSLVIVFDTTGSMEENLNQLRNGAKSITSTFAAMQDNPIDNYIFVDYNDPIVKDPVITKDRIQLLSLLDKIKVNGGEDCDELGFEGIQKGLEVANDDSYVFIFTDAPSKDKDKIPAIEKLIQRKRAQLFFIVHLDCNKWNNGVDYRRLAKFSNGFYFDVKGKEVSKIVQQIPILMNKNRTSVAGGSIKSNLGGTETIKPIIDSTMTDFILAISGTKPTVIIKDPSQRIINNYNRLASSDNSQILQFINPTPGTWTVVLSSAGPADIQVSAASDLVIHYGFSIKPPKSIENTAYQPLKSQENILTIAPSNNNFITNIQKCVFIDENGAEIQTLSMKKIIGTKGEFLFMTDSFQLTSVTFKIQLYGTDNKNYAIKRLISPQIKPTSKRGPESHASIDLIEVNEGEPINLICEAFSMIPITIAWKKYGNILATKNEEQTATLEYTIPNAQFSDAGNYECISSNNAGTSSAITKVTVAEQILKVKILNDKNSKVVAGLSRYTIECDVQPKFSTSIEWLYNNLKNLPDGVKIEGSNLVLNNLSRHQAGRYTCIGQKNLKSQQDYFDLKILYKPEITGFSMNTDSGVRSAINNPLYEIVDKRTVQLECKAEANPSVTISWMFNDEYLSSSNVITIDAKLQKSSGKYTCYVQNSIGDSEKSVELIIIVKPVLKNTNYQKNFKPTENQPFKLACPIVTDEDTEILWMLNGNEIDKNLIEKNNILSIPKLTSEMSGTYKCKAKNTAGEVEAIFDVNVEYPPKNMEEEINFKFNETKSISNNRKQITLIKGDLLNLQCNFNGNPKPNIYWEINDKRVAENSIKIDSVDYKNSGIYKCIGENVHGKMEFIYQVIVIGAPDILNKNGLKKIDRNNIKKRTVSVLNTLHAIKVSQGYLQGNFEKYHIIQENEDLDLDCSAEGYPKPEISWLKNEIPSTYSFEILNLQKAQVSDSGIYKCIQQNKYNTTSIIFNVIVQGGVRIIGEITEDISIQLNDPVKLICNAKGNYLPSIKFYNETNSLMADNSIILKTVNADKIAKVFNDHEKLYFSGNQEIYYENLNDYDSYGVLEYFMEDDEVIGQFSYIIKRYQNKDDTEYKCIVESTDNVKKIVLEKNYHINVLIPLFIDNPNIKDKQKIKLIPNIPFELVCPISGKPEPEILWTKDDVLINFKSDLTVEQSNKILRFKDPEHHNNGMYKCIVKNTVDGSVMTLTFGLTVKPLQTDIDDLIKTNNFHIKLIELHPKEEKILKCFDNFNGIVSWLDSLNGVNNLKFIESTKEFKLIGNKNRQIICSFTKDNQQFGTIFQIRVQMVPEIKTTDFKNKYPEYFNDELELHCEAYGEPNPEIIWYQNGNQIRKEDKRFNISHTVLQKSNTKFEDIGIYSCKAINKNGEVSKMLKDIQIKVKYLWTPFSIFGKCSAKCGLNAVKNRTRVCFEEHTREVVDFGCVGEKIEIVNCGLKPCPIDGVLTKWSEFSPCTKSCIPENSNEISIKTRSRNCIPPQFNGKECNGELVETLKCTVPICPINGVWGEWSKLSPCSTTCDEGIQTRTRKCIPPRHKGKDCVGSATENLKCNKRKCCGVGFNHEASTDICVDIDECKKNNGNCHINTQICVNSIGSYKCECKKGYRPIGPKVDRVHRCLEVNECIESPNICGADRICENTQGSYKCHCLQGYSEVNGKCTLVDK